MFTKRFSGILYINAVAALTVKVATITMYYRRKEEIAKCRSSGIGTSGALLLRRFLFILNNYRAFFSNHRIACCGWQVQVQNSSLPSEISPDGLGHYDRVLASLPKWKYTHSKGAQEDPDDGNDDPTAEKWKREDIARSKHRNWPQNKE